MPNYDGTGPVMGRGWGRGPCKRYWKPYSEVDEKEIKKGLKS